MPEINIGGRFLPFFLEFPPLLMHETVVVVAGTFFVEDLASVIGASGWNALSFRKTERQKRYQQQNDEQNQKGSSDENPRILRS